MTTRTRFTIFIIFALIFFVAAPYAVLTTAGYHFSWQKQKIERTSLLVLDSVPKDASISLNGRDRTETTPSRILQLVPGDYDIRISKSGYSSWMKKLSIASGQATFAEHARLWKQSAPTLQTKIAAARAVALSETTLLLVTETPSSTVAVWSPGNEPRVIWQTRGKGTADLMPSPDQSAALITLGGKSWVQKIENDPAAAIAFDGLVTKKIQSIAWDPGIPETLWATTLDRRLLQIRPWQHAVQDVGAAPGGAIFGHNGILYALRAGLSGLTLISFSPSNPGATQEIMLLPKDAMFVSTDAPYLIFQVKDEILVIDPGATEKLVLRKRATQTKWTPVKGDAILAGTDGYELWTWSQNKKTEELVTRSSAPIADFALHPDGAHALYVSGGALHAIEFDERDKKNTADFAAPADLRALFLADRGKRALVVGKDGIYELMIE